MEIVVACVAALLLLAVPLGVAAVLLGEGLFAMLAGSADESDPDPTWLIGGEDR